MRHNIKIPLSAPDVNENDIEAVVSVLRSRRLSLGQKLEELERAIANYIGVPHAIAVSSGTAALHLCVRALGVGNGDEVIVPSFTFIAVANAVCYERATPVFVDIHPQSWNLDPGRIEPAITTRTAAIIVPHTFGRSADLSAIVSIAHRHNLYVIEDACEAIGAEWQGQKVGGIGDLGVFAFYPNKLITTGEGGAVVTRDSSVATRIRALRNQGRYGSEDWFQHSDLGYNYRISELNCALGTEQLKRIDTMLKRRDEIASQYSDILKGCPELTVPVPSIDRISWFAYVVRLREEFTQQDRDWIFRRMLARGIEVGRYFAPVHLQPIYRSGSVPRNLPVTDLVAPRAIALPFFNRIKDSEIEEVCGLLMESVNARAQAGCAVLTSQRTNGHEHSR
jgi:perosamine synthetase